MARGLLGGLLVACPAAASAATGPRPAATWSLLWENDSWWALLWGLPYSDARYTNGLRAVVDQPLDPARDSGLARAARAVARGLRMGEADAVRLSVEQTMYTPEAYWQPVSFPFEHPYAALMTATGALTAREGWRRTSAALSLGITGPPAIGEWSQTVAHDAFGAAPPLGWDQQVQTEPVVELVTGIAAVEPLAVDQGLLAAQLVPALRARVGTRRLSGAVDTIVAVGTSGDLPASLPMPARPGQALFAPPPQGERVVGVALFAVATAEAVAHDLVLDGGTMRSIPAPGARPFIGELSWGGMVRVGPVLAWLVHSRRSPDHQLDPRDHAFGQAALSVQL